MGELFSEIAHEITADPTKFAIEIVQFGILVGIVWMVAVGFGTRQGMVTKMLASRRERVGTGIARIKSADGVLESASMKAAEVVEAGRKEAAATIADARRAARAEHADAKAAADAEAAQIRARANEVLDAELAEMHVQIREALVDVVAHATRSILNEGLTMAEQRDLIQNSVSGGIARVERSLDGRGKNGTVRAELVDGEPASIEGGA